MEKSYEGIGTLHGPIFHIRELPRDPAEYAKWDGDQMREAEAYRRLFEAAPKMLAILKNLVTPKGDFWGDSQQRIVQEFIAELESGTSSGN